jgi:hypothetical protein
VKIALVLGGAATVWSDARAAMEMGEFHGAVACNDASAAWPGELDAAVSLHAEKFGVWMERRARSGFAPPAQVIGHDTARTSVLRMPACVTGYTSHLFEGQKETGSSGLFALKVALIDLGFDRAVLCGVPMNEVSAHFFDEAPWGGALSHRRGWHEALTVIKGRARSMSGWTKDLLGPPDAAWLGA